MCVQYEGRQYCAYDYEQLFAPVCCRCNEFVLGRVIRALGASWHPACFRCSVCERSLCDLDKFVKNNNRSLPPTRHSTPPLYPILVAFFTSMSFHLYFAYVQ